MFSVCLKSGKYKKVNEVIVTLLTRCMSLFCYWERGRLSATFSAPPISVALHEWQTSLAFIGPAVLSTFCYTHLTRGEDRHKRQFSSYTTFE